MRRQAILAVLALTILCGCQTTPNVVGGCEIPQRYDTTKSVPADLPAGTKSKAFTEAATAERGQHKIDVDDFNGFHDYVKTNCAK